MTNDTQSSTQEQSYEQLREQYSRQLVTPVTFGQTIWNHQQAIIDQRDAEIADRQEKTGLLGQAIDRKDLRILELEAPHKWIPCSERLPEDDTPVLVLANVGGSNEYLTTAMRIWEDDGEGCSGSVWAQLCATYNPNLWDASEYAFDDNYEYTHWMPLPTPPEQE